MLANKHFLISEMRSGLGSVLYHILLGLSEGPFPIRHLRVSLRLCVFPPKNWDWRKARCLLDWMAGVKIARCIEPLGTKNVGQLFLETVSKFETLSPLMWCWRRLLRIPWTARRSNQSILKELNPHYSLEGLILKLSSNTLAI